MVISNQKLEEILVEIDKQEKTPKGRIRRAILVPFMVFGAGMLRRQHQEFYAKRLGWKEKDLTIRNALYFGLAMSAAKYFGAEGIELFENLDLIKNMESNFISQIADFLGTTSKTVLYAYATFDATQSLGRIAYSQITDKAIPSFCVSGIFANAGYESAFYFFKKKIKKREQI